MKIFPLILVLIFLFLKIEARKEDRDDDCSASEERPREHHKKHHKKKRTTTTTTTTKRVPSCLKGWTGFTRSGRTWCIRVIAGVENQAGAETQCNLLGAKLTGIANAQESQFLLAQSLPILQSLGKTVGSIWIGLVRRPECRGYLKSLFAPCIRGAGFMWTDGVVTDTSTITWRATTPDNIGWTQNCARLHVGSRAYQLHFVNPGDMDDMDCTIPASKTLDIERTQGFACGMWAD
ncbi:unnamed protein product [Caenorhabditis angaria]|uniref:C-type lectin domain-containing protein n=1 Tax=Caenorhabditis angaria TaxID=860376 RepID=A0A9P1IQW2_9PELO|nr:unnamed protein product [Caenorhabditis angaria]